MINRCPCCLSEENVFYKEINLFLCKNSHCHHRWQGEANEFIYNREYVSKNYNLAPTEKLSLLRLGLISNYCESGKLLDIGCGDGELVRQANRAGYTAYGNDVTGSIYAPYHDLFGNWDIVSMFDSLEHFRNPFLPLEFVKSKFWVVSVPVYDGDILDIRNWKHYKPDEHLNYFTDKSMERLFFEYKLLKISTFENFMRKNIKTFIFGAKNNG